MNDELLARLISDNTNRSRDSAFQNVVIHIDKPETRSSSVFKVCPDLLQLIIFGLGVCDPFYRRGPNLHRHQGSAAIQQDHFNLRLVLIQLQL